MSYLCTPVYLPDPGHKGPLVHPVPFYAIYCQEWAGYVTSSASRDRLLCQYPRASTFEAPTWAELLLSRTPSTVPTFEAKEARLEAEAAAKKKEELAFLVSTRGNVSPERMRRQFVRVLGPVSALEWPPPLSKSSLVSPKESTNTQAHNGEHEHTLFNPHGQTQACQQRLAMAAALPTKHHGEGVEQFWDNVPVMYAVSGQNCVFKDRERAMAVFKEMPGAELVFTRDEDKLFSFLEDFEKKFEI
ncbi:hypothetical protein DFH07DRAFT_952572 [Mycena maculata]|uniref:Uncharacterized protein n=1 Tax=Mycena maculata TaxID=230809 RepID=A0AAD7NTM6_9AGAR|nr:hypothetical protein DFH07DRAFT_952572 [Mycena maculata]